MIEKAFYRALKSLNTGAVYALVRGDQLPAVVYSLVSSPRTISVTAKPQMRKTRFQVDCYASSYDQAKEIATTIIDALHNTTTLADVSVQRVLLEDQRDQNEQKAELHRQLLQFVIHHH